MYIRWLIWSILILKLNIAAQNEAVRTSAQLIGAVRSWRKAIALRDAAEQEGKPTQLAIWRMVAQVGRTPMYFARGRIKS
jgi:hypothetical protein